jgi:hypothetical protein
LISCNTINMDRSTNVRCCRWFAFFMVLTLQAAAQVSNYKAYTLFIYNFTKYVQWPDGVIKDEFVIGVYGKSPIHEELQKLVASKKAGDKNIRIVEITKNNLESDVHILFIPEEESAQVALIAKTLKGRPVLLVTEKERLIDKGATISFMVDHNSLKFELSNTSIAAQNLKVSKTLEALAYRGPS